MTSPEKALTQRIKELRRRHFGPRGKAEFAERLGVPLEEYNRYERTAMPPGEVLLRMCEVTGEDLQWLLAGVAGRRAMVISGVPPRYQELFTKLADLLNAHPERAGPVEAFVDLLVQGEEAGIQTTRPLPPPAPHALIPILAANELPRALPALAGGDPGDGFPLALPDDTSNPASRAPARLAEPATDYDRTVFREVELVTHAAADGSTRQYLYSPDVAGCFPGVFGVRLGDNTMKPMFVAGDAVLTAPGAEPKVGHPVVCRLDDEGGFRCRVWLGADEAGLHLGRLSDGELEHIDRARVCWSLDVLYRLTPAA